MGSVTLDRIWLHDATDLASALPLLMVGSRSFTYAQPGEVRRYANGRLRAVSRAGVQRGVEALVSTDAAGLAVLQGWVGRVLLYRDGLGTRLFGVFFDLPWAASEDGRWRDVSLTLAEVSHVEAV